MDFFSIPSKYDTSQIADIFFKEAFILRGLSRNIVSDQDIKFISAFWQELFNLFGTKLTPSTSYHPQTDGQTKIVNKWIEGYLRNYVSGKQVWIK